MQLSIEKVTGKKEEIDAIEEIEQKCFPFPWSRNSIEDEVQNAAAIFLIAKMDDKICGYVSAWLIVPFECQIGNLAVLKEFQRQGIATALMQYLIDISKSNNIFEMSLEVRVSNKKAIALYEKLGFEKIGLRKNYYQGTEDALLMGLYEDSL